MVEARLPKEWETLPLWVKDELIYGSEELEFYRWHVQRLVDHSENMKAVWRLFEAHRESFTWKGPVHSILDLVHQAAIGRDPGHRRTDDDRQAIADDVQKHVDGLSRQLARLSTGAAFGLYPARVAAAVSIAALAEAEKRITEPFQSATERILADLDRVEIPSAIRRSVADQLELLHYEMEQEFMELYSDPREQIKTLADGAKEWAESGGWDRDDIIWHIGGSLRDWFGGNHYAATATLATAIVGEEVSEDVVAGVIKRRQRSKSPQKVKVKREDSSGGFDRPRRNGES